MIGCRPLNDALLGVRHPRGAPPLVVKKPTRKLPIRDLHYDVGTRSLVNQALVAETHQSLEFLELGAKRRGCDVVR